MDRRSFVRVCVPATALAVAVTTNAQATLLPQQGSAAAPTAVLQTADAAPDYLIGPKDILRITVYGHDDLAQQVLVQSDGTFMFPLIGRVMAGEMRVEELEHKLTTLLSRGFIRKPQVTVVVQEFRSKIVYVVGEVQKPGTYPLSGATTLVEVLAKAGPMTQDAAAEVLVVRPASGSNVTGPLLPEIASAGTVAPGSGAAPSATPMSEVIRVNIRDLQAGGMEKNVVLKPNDTVFVPQAPKVFVSGEVRNPGAYPYSPGMTARQLISVAGGLTQYGSDGRLRVVRGTGGKTREDKIKLDEAIQAGDTLVVRRKLF